MNRTTDRCKPVYSHFFQTGDIKTHYSKYGKKIVQIQGRINTRRLLSDPTIQNIIINLLTKYDYSSLHDFTASFDEKFHYSRYGKEEKWTNTGNKKHEKAGSQSLNTFLIINLHTKYD